MEEIAHRLMGCASGRRTRSRGVAATTGVVSTGEEGVGVAIGAADAHPNAAHAVIRHATVRQLAGCTTRFIDRVPRATPLDRRDLTESRRPISRVLSVQRNACVALHRTVIPLGVQSPTRSSSLPAARRLATSLRDGSSLAAYLALLRLGFTEPSSLPKMRWALTPPFHPYRNISCPMRRRFAFCCTIRRTKLTPHAPRRYLAVYPVEPGLSSVPELAPRHRDHPAGDRSMSTRNITKLWTDSYRDPIGPPINTSHRRTVTA